MSDLEPHSPTSVVQAVLAAVQRGDLLAARALCSDVLAGELAGSVGHDDRGLHWLFRALAGQLPITVGEARPVAEQLVVVPLTLGVDIGERSIDVQATVVWEVEAGRVQSVRAVPGDEDTALESLGYVTPPPTRPAADAIHTAWDASGWVTRAGGEVIARHITKHQAIAAGRRLARARDTHHIIERQDGSVAQFEGTSRRR